MFFQLVDNQVLSTQGQPDVTTCCQPAPPYRGEAVVALLGAHRAAQEVRRHQRGGARRVHAHARTRQ